MMGVLIDEGVERPPGDIQHQTLLPANGRMEHPDYAESWQPGRLHNRAFRHWFKAETGSNWA
jgi:hypothetical protein